MPEDDTLRQNVILSQLPGRELQQLEENGKVAELRVRDSVYEAGSPIEKVYFPLSSVLSMVAGTEEKVVVEIATIGREGMAGLPLFLGASTSPHACFCQIGGLGLEVEADVLRQTLANDGFLHRMLNRFAQATMVQIAQNVVCNNTHSVEQRAARWLLTSEDRVGRPEFTLTQEFLSQMLGVRRPTVSEVASRLQARELIRYHRGQMAITDRRRLEEVACQCYWIVRRELDDMLADTT